jgi:HD superfamily phosphohydrolase
VRHLRKDRKDWAHEHASADLLDHLIESNKAVREAFKSYHLNDSDIHFIKELIFGDEHEAPQGWVWKGRGANGGKAKQFLYEIVANHRNGIDVDKFDYFARDSMHLGMAISFDASRLMKFSRVYVDPKTGESQIAYHEKEAWNIFELFHTRYNLHKRGYQHRVARAVERMFTDALILADPHIVLGKNSKDDTNVYMSSAFESPEIYTNLTDSILHLIEFQARSSTSSPSLRAANDLLHRIKIRDLYRFVSEKLLDPRKWEHSNNSEIRVAVEKGIKSKIHDDKILAKLKQCGMYVDIVKINYGMGKKNPVEHIKFYLRSTDFDDGSQLEAQTIKSHQISCFVRFFFFFYTILHHIYETNNNNNTVQVPHVFEEVYARVYVKNLDSNIKSIVRDAFETWCLDLGSGSPTPLTPEKKKKKRSLAKSCFAGLSLLSKKAPVVMSKRRKLDSSSDT